jgi:SET and MYND domain-containing protein 4
MNWQIILDKSLENLKQTEDDLNEFKHLNTNKLRVSFLLDRKHVYLNEYAKYYSNFYDYKKVKNSLLSDQHRKKGNEFYLIKLNKNAFNQFNLALMYADISTDLKLIILAYSNRSAVFLDENLFQQCITDINNVFRVYSQYISNCDDDDLFQLIIKLLNRKKKCIQNQKMPKNDIYNSLNIFKFNTVEKEIQVNRLIEEINSICKEQETVHEVIKTFLTCNISSSIDIKYDSKRGRHCIANKEIKSGETLFIEKAYCAILLPECSNFYCQYCFKSIKENDNNDFNYLNIEFCSKCNQIAFCSLECKINCSFHHNYECEILDLLHNLGIAHLAYRVVASTPFDLLKNEPKSDLTNINYQNENNLSEIDYEQVFNLVTHEMETHVYDLFKYTMTSILLGMFYFKSNTLIINNDLILISSLILRFLLQSICNAHAITHVSENENDFNQQITYNREQLRYATAIYPKVSLLNHSCMPNVLSTFNENSTIIVVKASKQILPGEEIFNCYGPHYLKMNLLERKQSLLDQYRFDCLCKACLVLNNNNNNKKIKSNLKCLKCKSSLTETANHIYIECLNCSCLVSINEYSNLFEKLEYKLNETENYESKLELINIHKSYLFINEIISGKHRLEDNFKIFYLDYARILDSLARFNCNLNRFKEAANLTDQSIQILEFIYGDFGVELLNELLKLAEIQCNFNDFKSALKTVQKGLDMAQQLCSDQSKIVKEFEHLKNNILNF